jgi:hypothetical protein
MPLKETGDTVMHKQDMMNNNSSRGIRPLDRGNIPKMFLGFYLHSKVFGVGWPKTLFYTKGVAHDQAKTTATLPGTNKAHF